MKECSVHLLRDLLNRKEAEDASETAGFFTTFGNPSTFLNLLEMGRYDVTKVGDGVYVADRMDPEIDPVLVIVSLREVDPDIYPTLRIIAPGITPEIAPRIIERVIEEVRENRKRFCKRSRMHLQKRIRTRSRPCRGCTTKRQCSSSSNLLTRLHAGKANPEMRK